MNETILYIVLGAIFVIFGGVIFFMLMRPPGGGGSKPKHAKAPKSQGGHSHAPRSAPSMPSSPISGDQPVLEWEDHGQRRQARVDRAPFVIGREDQMSSKHPNLDIGRGASSNPDNRVSRTHAIIVSEAGGFAIVDNGSKNGVILNERILVPEQRYPLRDADCIQIAEFEIRFRHKASLETAPIVDGYEILELLGKGGMAAVFRSFYKGQGAGNQTIRAVKVPIQYGEDDESAERKLAEEYKILREIAQLRSESARYVVKAHEEGRTRDGKAYVVLECLEGGTLKDYMRACGGAFDEANSASVARQIGRGLQAVEKVGRVHCDVKLDNVLLHHAMSRGAAFRGDELRLIDFGISRRINSTIRNPFGAANYMSPEHIMGHQLTTRSDVYSLGCVLYELMSGTKLYPDAENASEIKNFQTTKPPEPVAQRVQRQRNASVSAPMEALVMRMLEKPAGNRPGLDEVVEQLEHLTRAVAR